MLAAGHGLPHRRPEKAGNSVARRPPPHTLKREGVRPVELWVADAARGLMRIRDGECRKMAPPCGALCALDQKIFCAGPRWGLCLSRETGATLYDFPVPTGVCALAGLGGALCALSSDADCVQAYGPGGELLFSAPAGDYPRDLCASPCGRYLAVAAGAAGEILLFDHRLSCLQRRRVAGAACAVCFLPRALAALCAVGDGELSSRLLYISPRGVSQEVLAYPGAPCSLCALPGGQCLAGCQERAFCLRPDGALSCAYPCAYPARIRATRMGPLLCDAWRGEVRRMEGGCCYRGEEPCDVCAFL